MQDDKNNFNSFIIEKGYKGSRYSVIVYKEGKNVPAEVSLKMPVITRDIVSGKVNKQNTLCSLLYSKNWLY